MLIATNDPRFSKEEIADLLRNQKLMSKAQKQMAMECPYIIFVEETAVSK